MKSRNLALPVLAAAGLLAAQATFAADPEFPPQPTPPVLTPEQELKTFVLPAGYKMELVLSDPLIQEPVLCVFDGNGRMYVAEMRTYMQDIDAKGEQAPKSRVSWHESSKGDGNFDKHGVFADNLLLPRTVLPLEKGRILLGLTNSTDVFTYSDTKGAGVADKIDLFYKGGPDSANMEHQPSGLIWSLDNWIYTTYNNYRLRWTPQGATLKETTPPNSGQWGLTQDNYGKQWWSNAGSEKGLVNFQVPILYGDVTVPDGMEPGFMEVWPAVGLGDFQGGLSRVRMPDKTLNHFTGCGGQEVVRVDRMPEALRGNVLLPEPVGRLIRRAVVTVKDGVTTISNPYQGQHSEFLRSTDPYFRPVNVANGPDGCLYIVDMYRGIIQEGDWVNEGSYLRKAVQQYGLDKNVGGGRIWRLVHKDFQPGPQPHMLDETPAQLVAYLQHPNGWWRDQAQKLIVLRQDKSVVPALLAMARTNPNLLARIHALWTLEGLGALDAGLIREKLRDPAPEMRAAAIRASESLFKAGDNSLKRDIAAMSKDPDPAVVLQVIGTSKVLKFPDWQSTGPAIIAASSSAGVKEIGTQVLYTPKPFEGKFYTGGEIKLLDQGRVIFQQLCFACHGVEGHGMPMDGQPPGTTLAPPLAGSQTVRAPYQAMVSVLLDGLSGPVNHKAYAAQMVPMGANNDDWIASIASFVRNSFGNGASVVTPAQVAEVRAEVRSHMQQWTLDELPSITPQPLPNTAAWKVTASAGSDTAALAIDGKNNTHFSTGAPQARGQWFQVELPEAAAVTGIILHASNGEYPRSYKVELSADGKTWGKPVAEGKGYNELTQIPFAPAMAKFIRITQTGSEKKTRWSISELQVLQPSRLKAPTLAGASFPK